MPSRLAAIYSSGTITQNGNSGWLDVQDLMGDPTPDEHAFTRATIRMVPASLATNETLDLDLNLAWTPAGIGDFQIHDFTQVTASNAPETLILPGGESKGSLVTAVTLLPTLVLPYWKFTWTLGGTTKSMSFTVTAVLEWRD